MRKLRDRLVGEDFPIFQQGQTWDLTDQVLANLSGLGIEHLIAIGGDDTLSYAAKLNELGAKIIAIPKTMDNDVRNTKYCSDAVQRQRTTIGSHERIGIFPSLAAMPDLRRSTPRTPPRFGASYPEYKVNLDKLIRLLLEDKRANPSNYALIVLSEGAEWEGYTLPGIRRARRLRSPQEGQRGRIVCRRDQAAHLVKKRSSLTSPTTCDRAIRTSSTSLWP
jgi:ATP-dependent phosphofructokinase / diphosphate-dependent phosphofructokinase